MVKSLDAPYAAGARGGVAEDQGRAHARPRRAAVERQRPPLEVAQQHSPRRTRSGERRIRMLGKTFRA